MANTGKRLRSKISQEQKDMLLQAFRDGMTSALFLPQVAAAAEVTGLPPAVIKNWIRNYQRVPRPTSTKRPPKAKVAVRATSGYNLFIGKHMREGTKASLKDINLMWKALDPLEKDRYRAEAAAVEAAGKIKPLTPEQRQLKINRHLRQMKIEVSSLKELGVETCYMAFDYEETDRDVHYYGSDAAMAAAMAFLYSTHTTNPFAFFQDTSSAGSLPAKEKPGDIVKRVQDLFNKKYHDAGGHGSMPYKALAEQKVFIRATGLPDGISLIKPSRYGRHQLEKILEAAEQLSFQIIDECGEEPLEPEPSTSLGMVTRVNEQCMESRLQTNSPDSASDVSVKQEAEDVSITQESEEHLNYLFMHGRKEGVSPGKERSPSLLQEEPKPPHIIEGQEEFKEEQEELLQRPEQPVGSTLTSLAVKDGEENDEETSSHCREVEVELGFDSEVTEDSDDWEESCEDDDDQQQRDKSFTDGAGGRPFHCKHCDKSFSHSSELRRHQYVHTGEKPFQCKYCGKSFSQVSNLKRHECVHTGEKPFQCKQCDKSFDWLSHLKAHLRVHTGETPFQCTRCKKRFSWSRDLRTHHCVHTVEKNIPM